MCLQSQHAHTKLIKYDAHLPFLQQARGLLVGGYMEQTVCHTLATLITLHLVEILLEHHL
jgi:hypothetical protein